MAALRQLAPADCTCAHDCKQDRATCHGLRDVLRPLISQAQGASLWPGILMYCFNTSRGDEKARVLAALVALTGEADALGLKKTRFSGTEWSVCCACSSLPAHANTTNDTKKSKHHAVHHDQKEQRRWCLGVWHHLCVLACERLTCSRVNVISVVQGNAIRMQPAVCGVGLHKGTRKVCDLGSGAAPGPHLFVQPLQQILQGEPLACVRSTCIRHSKRQFQLGGDPPRPEKPSTSE